MMLGVLYLMTDELFSVKIWILLFAIISYQSYKWVNKRKFQHSLFKRIGIPYVKPHLFYGSLHILKDKKKVGTELDIVSGWIKKYGNCFGYYLGPIPYLLVSDLDMVKHILVKNFSNFANRPKLAIKAQPVVATLVGLRDKEWKDVRSLLAPTFSGAKMKLMTSVMNKKVDEMMRIIDETSINMTPVGMYSVYQGLTLDVISECALALRTNCQKDQNKDPFFRAVRQFLRNAVNPAILWSMYFPFLAKVLTVVSNRLVLSGRATQMIISNLKYVIAYRRKNSHLRNNDLLQLMLDAAEDSEADQNNGNNKSSSVNTSRLQFTKRTLTDEEIIANAWVFLLGGFETTAASLTYTSYLLAKYPNIQDKLYEELSTKFKDGTDQLCYEDVTGLQYLDQVFNESLRLYPPVVTFTSREAKEDILINDVFIPRGMNVSIPIWEIHHNPEYWPEPYKFDPDRFAASSKIYANRHPMSFIPFGDGPRKCVGMRFAQMEAKLALTRILSKYRLEFCDKTPDPLKFEIPTVSLNPTQEVFIKVVQRSSCL